MTSERQDVLRRYVLGAATPDQDDAIERDYFERAEVMDRMKAVEDELIDDYLSSRLPQAERAQFEQHYLATPNHRRRVAIMRAVRSAAASSARVPQPARWWLAAIAASILLLAAGGAWMVRSLPKRETVALRNLPTPPPPTSAAAPPSVASAPRGPTESSRGTSPARSSLPVVVAVSLSPILVRSADAPAAVTIGVDTNLVRLQLQGLAGEQPESGQVVIRTVGGREIWRGPATRGTAPQDLARVEVPAPALPADDYIIELTGSDAAGRDVERHRYFLRVQRQ